MNRSLEPAPLRPSEMSRALLRLMTVQELAKACGVNTRQVYNWKEGKADAGRITAGTNKLRLLHERVSMQHGR